MKTDTGNMMFIAIVVMIFTLVITGAIVDSCHDTEHVYWTSDSKYEAIDEGIEELVNGEIDSLIVTHPNKPSVVGYVYFREE